MSHTPILYTVDLGFNWNSSLIGTAFGNPLTYRSLQYGMINPNGSTAAWATMFGVGDQLRFHITDITHTSGANPESVADTWQNPPRYVPCELSIGFANPVGATALYPFANQPEGFTSRLGTSEVPGINWNSSQLVFQPSRTDSAVYNVQNQTWQVARWYAAPSGSGENSAGQVLTFGANFCFAEMAVLLTVVDSSTDSCSKLQAPKQFIFDPEMFIGDGLGG